MPTMKFDNPIADGDDDEYDAKKKSGSKLVRWSWRKLPAAAHSHRIAPRVSLLSGGTPRACIRSHASSSSLHSQFRSRARSGWDGARCPALSVAD